MNQVSQEHHHLLQNHPWKELANARDKEEIIPCILIAQLKRALTL